MTKKPNSTLAVACATNQGGALVTPRYSTIRTFARTIAAAVVQYIDGQPAWIHEDFNRFVPLKLCEHVGRVHWKQVLASPN